MTCHSSHLHQEANAIVQHQQPQLAAQHVSFDIIQYRPPIPNNVECHPLPFNSRKWCAPEPANGWSVEPRTIHLHPSPRPSPSTGAGNTPTARSETRRCAGCHSMLLWDVIACRREWRSSQGGGSTTLIWHCCDLALSWCHPSLATLPRMGVPRLYIYQRACSTHMSNV